MSNSLIDLLSWSSKEPWASKYLLNIPVSLSSLTPAVNDAQTECGFSLWSLALLFSVIFTSRRSQNDNVGFIFGSPGATPLPSCSFIFFFNRLSKDSIAFAFLASLFASPATADADAISSRFSLVADVDSPLIFFLSRSSKVSLALGFRVCVGCPPPLPFGVVVFVAWLVLDIDPYSPLIFFKSLCSNVSLAFTFRASVTATDEDAIGSHLSLVGNVDSPLIFFRSLSSKLSLALIFCVSLCCSSLPQQPRSKVSLARMIPSLVEGVYSPFIVFKSSHGLMAPFTVSSLSVFFFEIPSAATGSTPPSSAAINSGRLCNSLACNLLSNILLADICIVLKLYSRLSNRSSAEELSTRPSKQRRPLSFISSSSFIAPSAPSVLPKLMRLSLSLIIFFIVLSKNTSGGKSADDAWDKVMSLPEREYVSSRERELQYNTIQNTVSM